MKKIIPLRTCIVTREKLPKDKLIRISKIDGAIKINTAGGRGYYIKKDIDVINKARKSKILSKIFKENVSEQVYDELSKMIK